MDKSKKVASDVTTAPCNAPSLLTTIPDSVNNPAIQEVQDQLHKILTGCSPEQFTAIHVHLSNPTESDRMMLEAWARCGRNDRQRTVNLNVTEAARRTLTPMGLACLVTYARAWVDEAIARQAQVKESVDSLFHARRAGRPRKKKGQPRARPARATA